MSNKLLNIIMGLLAAFLLMLAMIQRYGQKTYTVEDFSGKTYQDVIQWMEKNSVPEHNVVFDHRYSDTVPENGIISQSISPNRTVSGNNSVVIAVSQGEDPYQKIELIDFTGMDQESITDWFEENRIINYQFITKLNEDIEEGLFVSSEPAAGIRIAKDAEVIVEIAEHDHSPTVAFPDFSGKTRNDIQDWADKYDISVNYIYYYDNSAKDSFLFSDFAVGTEIDKGGRISVAISNGSGE